MTQLTGIWKGDIVEQALFEAVSQYVFGALFVALFLYEVRTAWKREQESRKREQESRKREQESRKREQELMNHLEKLSSSYEKAVSVMQSMQETQKAMKNEIDKKLDKIYEKIVK